MTPPRVLPLALASAAAAALAAGYTLGVYLPTYNTALTPLDGVPRPTPALAPAPARPALARRLVFVVMDGLSFDLARELDELADLRRAGALRLLFPPFPTYTSPALVSFVTGLDPRDHGIRLNGDLTGALDLDTLTLAARDAGVPAILRSREWLPFEELMYPARKLGTPLPLAPPPGVEIIRGRVRFAWSMARCAAGLDPAPPPLDGLSPARSLELVYLGEVDEAGHRHGGASPQYVAAAHHAGALVDRLARSLDLEQDALVLASDHGHRPDGGHGGVEPEVHRAFFLAAGRGVRRGVELDPRPTRDIASTLSALGGLRVPATNLGRPMLDALDLPEGERARALAAPFAQAGAFACSVRPSPRCASLAPLGARLAAGDAAATAEAEALLDALAADRARDDDARAASARALRFGAAVAPVALALAALGLRRRDDLRRAARLLPFALLHAAVYAAAMFTIGYRPSLSAMPGENYNRDTFISSAAAFVATLVVVILARPPLLTPWVLLVATAAPVALLAAWVGADPAVLPPPATGALLFEIAPLVLSAASTAFAMRIVQRWPGRFS